VRPLAALALALAACAPQVQAAAPLPLSSHPIHGIWRLALPALACVETYRFRADGSTLVTSGAEVSESQYVIPAQPSAKGFYKLEDRIVKDNGKRDCAGSVMKVGTRATHFVRFHPSGSLFLLCSDETMTACIGPFERVTGEEA
jgi:hypothetical protein